MDPTITERIGIALKGIPVPVLVIACLYIAVGIGGSVVHFPDRGAPDWIWIEATEVLAIICGVFLLRAHNWARWLACAWMALHVAISYGEWRALAIHGAFLVAIAYGLFRSGSGRFFKSRPSPSTR